MPLVIAFSAKSLSVKTSSVVLLPSLYAACVGGIKCFLTLSFILPITHMESIFLSMDSSMIGHRFSWGSFWFPWFLNGG